jgi:hypothetical protein
MYGEKTLLDGETFYTFPAAETVAAFSERDLEPLKSG